MKKKLLGIFVCTLLIIVTVIPVTGNVQKKPVSPLISTYVNKITPYNIPTSTLEITAMGPSDLDEVTLHYRWSKDNETWTGLKEYTIEDDFETGTHDPNIWSIHQSGDDARIQWDYETAHSGSYSCAMDDYDTQQNDNSLNVIYTAFDFTGARIINLNFWEREWGDEAHNAPDSWTGWGNYDVVAFTNDGTTWYELVSESQLHSNSFKEFNVNITDHPDFISPVTSSFSIAFQQYDNYRLTDDGRAWDDIIVEYTIGVASVNWTPWINPSNPDTSYPWNWGFNFPDGPGYYEFYSIGKIIGEETEPAPSVADAICRYTRKPEISDERPVNGSDDVNIKPELKITISDKDGDDMNLKWYSNSEGSWKIFASEKNVGDGIYDFVNNNFSDFDTTYYWYVEVNDSIFTVKSPTFHFTTEENQPPYTPNDPDPADGATGVAINDILSWSGGDPNYGDKVYYDVYFGTSNPPPIVAEDISNTAYDPGEMELDTTYYWQIISEDSQGETAIGSIWEFTTEEESNAPPTRPNIYGTPQGPPGIELCWLIVARDFDEHKILYKIDWGDGNTEDTDYHPEGEAVEVCHTYSDLGNYTITVIAEDEKGVEGLEGTFEIMIQNSRSVFQRLLTRFFVRYPNAFPILQQLLRFFK
jgi:hypothetical protein